MTSQIAKTSHRSTACYDLDPKSITMIRKLSEELGVPAGNLIQWCIDKALSSSANPVRELEALRQPTMKVERFPFRLKRVR
jgi:hypothetical protein